jgi:HPr kinase/phosphorylase
LGLRLAAGAAGLDRPLDHARIQKSGLMFVGHTVGVVPSRIQIVGETEYSYLESLPREVRLQRIEEAMERLRLSCVIVTRGVTPLPELVECADRTATPLFLSSERSSATIAAVHRVLDRLLAASAQVHGVLVEIHGIGLLLHGPSAIGKSECALFLVERGHRLVADDAVVLTLEPSGQIIGRPVPLLRDHIEVRGIGILNVRDLFGATAVRESAPVDVVVELCRYRDDEEYERLGLDEPRIELLGQRVAMLKIPVRPGRDMGVLLEVAARNQLLKRAGHHPARQFARHLASDLALATDDVPPDGETDPSTNA